MSKPIVLTIAGTDISFTPTPEVYGEYLGAVARGDLADGSNNFAVQSSASEEDKKALLDLAEGNPGMMVQVASVVRVDQSPQLP